MVEMLKTLGLRFMKQKLWSVYTPKCWRVGFWVCIFFAIFGCQKRQRFDFTFFVCGPHSQIRLKVFSLLWGMNTSLPVPKVHRTGINRLNEPIRSHSWLLGQLIQNDPHNKEMCVCVCLFCKPSAKLHNDCINWGGRCSLEKKRHHCIHRANK